MTVELVAVVVLVVFFDADGVTVLLIVKLVVAASIVVEGTVVGTTLVKGSMPFVERFKPPKAIKFKRQEFTFYGLVKLRTPGNVELGINYIRIK